MYACPQCLPSDIVSIRSWTRTLRPPGIRHRHLPCHTMPYHMKLFNDHSGLRGLPRFIKGIYWATGLFLRTPFTEECAGANKKASPPRPLAVIRNMRLNSVAFLVVLRSVQFSLFCTCHRSWWVCVGVFFFVEGCWLIGLRFVFGAWGRGLGAIVRADVRVYLAGSGRCYLESEP